MDVIAHYNLLERIGRGGLGDTYRARDTRVGRTVALKLVSSDVAPDAYSRSRLLEEAQVAAQLSHPNVSTLFDTGETDGQVYLAYEYAPGRPLREEMAGAAMNLRRALEVAVQLSDAVADAHAHGIIHGDLRPDTIHHHAEGQRKDSRLRIRAVDARRPAADPGRPQPRQAPSRHRQGPRVSVARAGAGRRNRLANRRTFAWGRLLRDADRPKRFRRSDRLGHGRERHSGTRACAD